MEHPISEFLTKEELQELTGLRQVKRQIEWLKLRHYPIQSIGYKPNVLFKDVYGFYRNPATNKVSQSSKWQPPPL